MFPSPKIILRPFRCLSSVLSLALLLSAGSAVTGAVAGGRICTSNDTFMFGNRSVGSSATATATVTNCGDAPWSFSDVSVHPATGPAFQVSTTCTTGLTLAPGATCTVSVRFAPTTPGQTSGGLWLHNTTTTPDQLITFYGRGVDVQNGSASLAFVPASADFAAQAVGSQSMPLTVELHSLGPAALTLSALVLNGPGAYDFVVRNSTCQIGAAIVAGDSCQMWFYFRPLAAGTRLANLVIDSPQLASLAIMQISGVATPIITAPTVDVIEFYNAAMDHYFMSSLLPDIEALDSGHFPGWVRTGHSFKGYPQSATGASPVCRFYMPAPQDSHFYSASTAECSAVAAKYPTFVLEAPDVFYISLPDTATGTCPAATVPVFRLFNNRADANHRYTTDLQIKAQMIGQGYTAEGYGPSATIMCAPQ
jgi:Abnormal spindle-like microcephaly-assoc'd, ASPM-SPD-2-Hydin/Repeat of unknown function (DUF5648)